MSSTEAGPQHCHAASPTWCSCRSFSAVALQYAGDAVSWGCILRVLPRDWNAQPFMASWERSAFKKSKEIKLWSDFYFFSFLSCPPPQKKIFKDFPPVSGTCLSPAACVLWSWELWWLPLPLCKSSSSPWPLAMLSTRSFWLLYLAASRFPVLDCKHVLFLFYLFHVFSSFTCLGISGFH